jgi:hypothetical protein
VSVTVGTVITTVGSRCDLIVDHRDLAESPREQTTAIEAYLFFGHDVRLLPSSGRWPWNRKYKELLGDVSATV